MPALGVAFSVYGFTQVAAPLASVLPQALPGCNMYTLPDFTEVLLPAAGAVHTRLAVPDTVALAGVVVHHHVVSFELNPSMQVLAITSTNALSLTLGTF